MWCLAKSTLGYVVKCVAVRHVVSWCGGVYGAVCGEEVSGEVVWWVEYIVKCVAVRYVVGWCGRVYD